jgi:hypothetical protein
VSGSVSFDDSIVSYNARPVDWYFNGLLTVRCEEESMQQSDIQTSRKFVALTNHSVQ